MKKKLPKAFCCLTLCLFGILGSCTPEQTIVPDMGTTPKDLSATGTANCYIVPEAGSYKFLPRKGVSNDSVGSIATAEVIWESFGTDIVPNVGDLVKNVKYNDGYISFETPSTYRKGNAVIAAKDADGVILWSWHIWLTDMPQKQEYFNNAGIVMDRNLGAISATPGDVGAIGLLYQWGRKDPFLGSASINSNIQAKSTITWPEHVSSNSNNGTIEYATANPATFIICNSHNSDWYYADHPSTDDTRWTESNVVKSIYDPCPSGWRVPDGEGNGVWAKAFASSSPTVSKIYQCEYDSINIGMNLSGKLGSDVTIWYPISGTLYSDGGLNFVSSYAMLWSATPSSFSVAGASCMKIDRDGKVYTSTSTNRGYGLNVRCILDKS